MSERYDIPKDLLADKTILITGASDGIGRVAAKTFAEYGAVPLLLARDRKKLEQVSDEIVAATSISPLIIPFDLALLTSESVDQLGESLLSSIPELDGILHNASLLGPKVPLRFYDAHEWDKVMHVNVTAAFLLTKLLLPTLSKSMDASVIFTSSGVGRKGRAYWGAYAVSKFATEGLMEVFADESEGISLRVNSINPGGTRTAMRATAYPAEDPSKLPLPEEHMDLYLFLMGHESRGKNGKHYDAQSWQGIDFE